MAISKTMIENEENIRSALNEGLSGEAVAETINDMIEVSESYNYTPHQVMDTLETIIDMKKNVESKTDEQYASELIKENNGKIKDALDRGISPEEIATSLMNEQDGKKIKFTAKLVSKVKEMELKLEKENTDNKAKQFVKVNNNSNNS